MGVIISKNPNFIFIHIPKNGGSYFYKNIIKNHRRSYKFFFQKFCKYSFDTHITLSELEETGQLEKFYGNQKSNVKVLAIVRNPWARFWSLYKFRLKNAKKRIDLRKENKPVKGSTSDFIDRKIVADMEATDFSTWLLTEANSPTYPDGKNFQTRDQITYFESKNSYPVRWILYEDFPRFSEEINEITKTKLVWNFNNYSSNDYREYYSDEARKLVEKNFARDIDKFNYSF